MSKIGKKPILIPGEVKIEDKGDFFEISGKLGNLKIKKPSNFDKLFELKIEDGLLKINLRSERGKKSKQKALWGLMRMLLANAFIGVTQGWKQEVILEGLEYSADLKDRKLIFKVGKSHLEEIEIPEDINVSVKSERGRILLTFSCCDKEKLGNFVSKVISIKKRDIYKGKGFRLAEEILKLKPVKKTVGS